MARAHCPGRAIGAGINPQLANYAWPQIAAGWVLLR
jgi:hypothetical protein